jgi:hypothetical protein
MHGGALMPWHEDETQLGQKQSLTSEGFLIARDVPLARTGIQHYAPHELLAADIAFPADRLIEIERTADEVFAPTSIRSFEGKPLVDEHPADFIGPDDVAQHQIGTVFNVRRGAPPDDDLLLGDLIITSPRGIALVRNGKRAVSVGYSANYDQTGPASARQTKIRANHIALVDEGRCGDRCMIGDRAMRTRDQKDDPYDRAFNSHWANIQTSDPQSKVGGELVMRLPGPLSAYYLSVDEETQQPALFRYPLPEIDPGQVGTSRGTVQRTMDRGPAYYTALRRQGDVARELAAAPLKAMNEANRNYWAKR